MGLLVISPLFPHGSDSSSSATQKRRTTSQKQADEALAAKAKSTQAKTSLKEHQRKIKTIATAEDNLRQEDKDYGTNQLETLTIAEQMKSGKGKAKQKGNEVDLEIDNISSNSGSDYEGSRTGSDQSEQSDSDGDIALELDDDDLEEQGNKKRKSKNSHKPKQRRGMREDIGAAHTIPAEAGAKFKKRKEADQSEEIEAERVVVKRKCHILTVQRMIATAKRKKHNQAMNSAIGGNVGSQRTTATMGLCVAKVEVNEAVQEGKQKKSLRERSKSDLPFKGKTHAKQWDQLIRALLDWAGTTNDPFGTNEHPDLMEQLQDLWNMDNFFEDIEIDIADHPAVKKKVQFFMQATDRLNEWRSKFGKRALKLLKRFFVQNPIYRNDPDARAELVAACLPHTRDGKKVIPFIYGDPEKLLRSWEDATLLDIFSYHVQRVRDALESNGPPSGALTLSTAAYERALTLYKSGENAKELEGEDGEPNSSKRSKKHEFDTYWGAVARGYTASMSSIPAGKWMRIISYASSGQRTNSRQASTLDVVDDVMEARANIPISDGEDEDNE
ncbi:hypothetical protein P692DRAFT_201870409 [Suillus brevipes Sb2]|nr:hypothetical protein P692DRAFT_201870409 [Suillus brevipes Sb2]